MTQRAYARHRGVTHAAVQKAIAAGRITVEKGGTIDAAKADRDWSATTEPRMNGHRTVRSAGYLRARTAREQARAKLTELDLGLRTGELLDAAEVRRVVFSRARRARDLMLTIPARLAPVVAGITDAKECYRLLEAEVRRVCDELADPSRDAW